MRKIKKHWPLYAVNVTLFTILGLMNSQNGEVDITKVDNSTINWWWGLGGAMLGVAAANIQLKVAGWYIFDWIDADTQRFNTMNQTAREELTAIEEEICPPSPSN